MPTNIGFSAISMIVKSAIQYDLKALYASQKKRNSERLEKISIGRRKAKLTLSVCEMSYFSKRLPATGIICFFSASGCVNSPKPETSATVTPGLSFI